MSRILPFFELERNVHALCTLPPAGNVPKPQEQKEQVLVDHKLCLITKPWVNAGQAI